jgi:hypothetical protein
MPSASSKLALPSPLIVPIAALNMALPPAPPRSPSPFVVPPAVLTMAASSLHQQVFTAGVHSAASSLHDRMLSMAAPVGASDKTPAAPPQQVFTAGGSAAASAPAGTAPGAEEAAGSARGGGRRERGAEMEVVLAENEALKQAIRRFEEEVLSHDDL